MCVSVFGCFFVCLFCWFWSCHFVNVLQCQGLQELCRNSEHYVQIEVRVSSSPTLHCLIQSYYIIIESQNGLGWKGPQNPCCPTPAMGRAAPYQLRLLRAPFNLALNASRDGASTTSLGNLFQCFTTLCVKNFLLISNLNLPCLSLKPFPLVLSLSTHVNSHLPQE